MAEERLKQDAAERVAVEEEMRSQLQALNEELETAYAKSAQEAAAAKAAAEGASAVSAASREAAAAVEAELGEAENELRGQVEALQTKLAKHIVQADLAAEEHRRDVDGLQERLKWAEEELRCARADAEEKEGDVMELRRSLLCMCKCV
jgi:polyribonucleotide nucleotidyltransferase